MEQDILRIGVGNLRDQSINSNQYLLYDDGNSNGNNIDELWRFDSIAITFDTLIDTWDEDVVEEVINPEPVIEIFDYSRIDYSNLYK